MATPTSAESRLHARGFKKTAEWGTALALGALNEVLVVAPGFSGLDVPAQPIDPALESDTPFVKKSELLQIPPVDIAVPVRLRYEMGAIGSAIAMVYGTAGVPTKVSTTKAYKHIFQWKDEISGLFGVYAEERPSKIFEAPSVKPYRVEFNFSNGILMANVGMRCNNVIDNSTVNTATQVDALTLPATFFGAGVQAMFAHAAVKMNAESGADVAEETALVLSDFNMVFERPLEAGQHVAGSNTIIEPLEEGQSGPGITVTLNFPRMSTVNNAFFQTFLAGTEQKLLIKLTGSLIEETYYHDLAFYFPRMKMQNPNYPVEEIVKSGLTLQAEQAAAAPTGMTYLRPYLEIINQQTTDYLA